MLGMCLNRNGRLLDDSKDKLGSAGVNSGIPLLSFGRLEISEFTIFGVNSDGLLVTLLSSKVFFILDSMG